MLYPLPLPPNEPAGIAVAMTTLLVEREPAEVERDDVLTRQDEIMSVLSYHSRPTTLLGWKAAAIAGGTPSMDGRYLSAVRLAFPQLVPRLITDGHELRRPSVRRRALELVRATPVLLRAGNHFQLATRPSEPIACSPLFRGPVPFRGVGSFPRTVATTLGLTHFERVCFRGRTLVEYDAQADFGWYVYTNLRFLLGLSDEQLARDAASYAQSDPEPGVRAPSTVPDDGPVAGYRGWRVRLLQLLLETGRHTPLALLAFSGANAVEHEGRSYDVSFVPEIPGVQQLAPRPHQSGLVAVRTDADSIRRWYTIRMRAVHTIERADADLFRTFPFKQGHVVLPTGKVVAIPGAFLPPPRKSTKCRLEAVTVCHAARRDRALQELAADTECGEVIHWALFGARTLAHQAVAMLLLRLMVGAGSLVTVVGSYSVPVPSDVAVLAWIQQSSECSRSATPAPPNPVRELALGDILPPVPVPGQHSGSFAHLVELTCDLVTDLAATCGSEYGVVLAASQYTMPECVISAVLARLDERHPRVQLPASVCSRAKARPQTETVVSTAGDAERYTAITMLLRSHNLCAFKAIRASLGRPTFGRLPLTSVDWSRYRRLRTTYREVPHDTSLPHPHDRRDRRVLPCEVSDSRVWAHLCPEDGDATDYRLRPPRLYDLAKYGADDPRTELGTDELMVAIALAIEYEANL